LLNILKRATTPAIVVAAGEFVKYEAWAECGGLGHPTAGWLFAAMRKNKKSCDWPKKKP
jgi:hypothetical protein